MENAHTLVIKALPPSTERLPIFVIGDVHGCAKELAELLQKAKERCNEFQPILVGDLFTKGPDPVGVFDLIHEHNIICIKGNHDWALTSAILHMQRKGDAHLPEHTRQTLYLIRYNKRAIFDFLQSLPHAITTTIVPKVVKKNWDSEYQAQIIHAGIDCTAGLLGTPERTLLTARYMRWEERPEGKKLMLVSSSSRVEMKIVQKPEDNVQKFRWHRLHNGPELLIFGHDANQGLFRKTMENGRPICVGVDTGCTYGRCLTGYFPEFDDAIQVNAHRIYFNAEKNIINLKYYYPNNGKDDAE